MRTYICDRCKKVIDANLTNISTKHLNDPTRNYDLCIGCATDFQKNFMYNLPIVTREQAEKIVTNLSVCEIHGDRMTEFGQPDMCGTYPVKCQRCENEERRG